MDPTGGKIIDEIMSTEPTFTQAVGNNDMTTIGRSLNEMQKLLELLPPHITQPRFRAVATTLIANFNNVATCISQGTCGLSAIFQNMLSCGSALKAFLY